MNFQVFKLDLERAEESEIKMICWIIEKATEFQKTSTSALLTMPKRLCVSQETVETS